MVLRLARALGLCLLVLLAACAPLQPHLGPEKSIVQGYNESPTLPNAIKVGESMRDRYVGSVENRILWEHLSGAGLIGLTAIAADLAIRSVAKSEVLGLGVAAGAIYVGSNWLNPKPQQYIYAAGANAVQCALDTMLPLQIAYGNGKRDDLATNIPKIQRQADDLDARLKRDFAQPASAALPNVVQARATVDRARALLPQARQALGVLDGAGPRLRSALSGIQQQVTNAVVANSPNLQSLVDALGKELPASGGRILGVPLPGVPVPSGAPKMSSGADADLVGPTATLDTLLVDTEYILELVRARVPDDRLRQCNVDLQQAGLSMAATPSQLSLQAGQSATIGLTGGVLPYRATWIGLRPPQDQVRLEVESGRGEVTVTATGTAQTATYTLLLADAAKARETVPVAVTAVEAPGGGNRSTPVPGAAANAAACTRDPVLEKVQQALVQQGFKTAKVNGKEQALVVDGCMGPVTRAAMRAFYKSQFPNAAAEQVPKEDKQLQREVAGLLGIKG